MTALEWLIMEDQAWDAINAEAETSDPSAGATSLTGAMRCMGDAPRGQAKDPSQLMLALGEQALGVILNVGAEGEAKRTGQQSRRRRHP